MGVDLTKGLLYFVLWLYHKITTNVILNHYSDTLLADIFDRLYVWGSVPVFQLVIPSSQFLLSVNCKVSLSNNSIFSIQNWTIYGTDYYI